MDKRQGVANIVNKKTGKKYTLKSTNLDNLIKNYFESLKNGTHPNTPLQNDYNNYGKDNFEVEIIADNCTSKEEINRIANREIRKNASKSYNRRKSNENFGKRNEYASNSCETQEELSEYLSNYIYMNNLPHYYKKDLEIKINDGTINTKKELDDVLKQKYNDYEELLEIIYDSGLPRDEKRKMKKEIKKYETKKESLIDRIHKIQHSSSNNTHIKKQETNLTPKSNGDDFIVCPSCGQLSEKSRNFCKVCGINLIKSDDIICPECGRVLDEDETFCKVCGISLENVNIINCPNCSHTCRRIDMFCDFCGFPLNDTKCPNCGATWDKNKTSCKKCGFSLENSNFVVCPKCSNVCSNDENYCDFCGYEFKKPINNLIGEIHKNQDDESKSKHSTSYKETYEKKYKSENRDFNQFLIDVFGSILSVQKDGSPPRLSFSKCMGFLFFLLSLTAAILTIPIYKNPFMIIIFIFCGLIYYSIFRGIGAIIRIFKD